MNKRILFVVFIFLMVNAFSQEQTIQNIKTGFEKVIRSIQQVGSFADTLIRSKLRQSEQSPFVATRRFNEQFEVGSETFLLSIKNEFGRVSVRSWNNPIVKVEANVSIGGKSNEVVEKVIDGFSVGIVKEENTVYISNTALCEGVDYLEVDYDLVVPRFTNVNIENFFGDVTIREISGDIKVMCQFGNVDVQNIVGNVSINAQGEFSLLLKRVNGSATLNLIRTKADIEDIKGDLNLSCLMGEVLLRQISSLNSNINIDGGEMRYYIMKDQNCRIVGSMLGGEFISDLPVVKKSIGYFTKVEVPSSEPSNKLQFSANFANVYVLSESKVGNEGGGMISGAKPFTDVATFEEEVSSEDVLIVNSQRGGIHLIGSETDKVTVKISRLVWSTNSERVPMIMERIVRDFHRTDNRVYLTVRAGLEDLGSDVVDWRVDIQITCPKSMSVNVESGGGECTFEFLEKSLRVTQDGGNLTLKNINGEYFVSISNGNLYLDSSEGVGDLNIKKGSVSAKFIKGSLSLNGYQTRVNFEDVSAQTRVFLQNGEVKALYFSDLANDLEVNCKDGNISLILPPNPDCKLRASVNGGVIDSTFSLTGTFSRMKQYGEAVLGSGKYNVVLECNNGDIFIGGKVVSSEKEEAVQQEAITGEEGLSKN